MKASNPSASLSSGVAPGTTGSSTAPGTTAGGLKLGSLGTPSLGGGVKPGLPTQLNLPTIAPTVPGASTTTSVAHSLSVPVPSAVSAGPTSSTSRLPSLGTSGVAGFSGLTNAPATGGGGAGVAAGKTGAGTTCSKKFTYRELEDLVNKWSRELQDQERLFLQQADMVGQWDTVLQKNGERIITLNEEVERIVADQKRLDNELDLIDTQQNDLEEVLSKLEKTLATLPPISTMQHADAERDYTYNLVKRIDSQLTQMGKDLTDIIEQMNTAGYSDEEDDHMSQIVQILNAHADSLNWIDRNTALVQQKVEQVSTMVERQCVEHEKSFHMAFGKSV